MRDPLFIELVFDAWTDKGEPVDTTTYINLSIGDFHSGSTFKGLIFLDEEQRKEIGKAIKSGYIPTFRVLVDNDI